MYYLLPLSRVFSFQSCPATEIYTLSLHDALPISGNLTASAAVITNRAGALFELRNNASLDRKSTRLNSSHLVISYAVFCLKKKKQSTSISLRNKKKYFHI